MFQQNLSAPDVGAASAITPGVVDKSGAMRAQAEAQRFKDIQAFGMAAMETGFAIDKHIQTSRLAEKQQTLSEDFATKGLDAFSDEDINYLQQYSGNLSAIQKDQLKPHMYKALAERAYKEAAKSRPWLADELRRVSGQVTGMAVAGAAVELSLQSQAVREREMVAMQQQREAELKAFSDSLSDDFTKPEVDLFMSQVTPDMSAQDVRNLFYSNEANVARVTMGAERRMLENKAALYTQQGNVTQAQIDMAQANLVTQISQNNLINIQVSGQSAILSNMENFSSEGQQLLSNAISSGDSLYMMMDGLSKTDQQMAISILQSEYDSMRQQVESAFGGIGAKDIPPVVKSQLQRAESLIETFKGHLSGDSAATRQLQADVRRGDLEMTAEVQSFLKLLKEEDRAAWNLFLANKALDAGGKIDDQRMSLAIRELNQRQLADPATVPGALGAKVLSLFTDKSLLAMSNEAAAALTPEEQRRRSGLIAEAAFMPFASLETFQYQDLVESSEALTRLDEGFRNQILAELNPQDRETVGNNMLQSAQSRMRQIAQRIERTSSLSVEAGADGRPVIKAERVTFAGMPSSLNMRERNKLTQELNAIYNFMLPAMEMIYPDGLFNDSFENQLNSLILGSQVEGGDQSPFDQAAGVLRQAASSVGNFVIGEAQAMGGRPIDMSVQEDEPGLTIEISGGTPEDVVEGIPSNIDFDFISEQEGNRLDMYVPMSKGKALGISGPTIGTGVDIGQRSVEDLRGLPQDLIEKLSPYTQKTGQDAVRFVRDNPLKLSNDEIRVINSWAKKQETESLLRLWERDSDIPWDSLTKEQATAVSSVMYQYGSGRVRTPNFWRMATTGQWDKVEEELRNFGDKYSSRRNREADYLSRGRK